MKKAIKTLCEGIELIKADQICEIYINIKWDHSEISSN